MRRAPHPLLVCAVLVGTLLHGGPAAAQDDDLAARGRQATQAMNEGRYLHAAAIYRELVKALPSEAGLQMNLGMALALAGHEADALEPLQRAVALDPSLLPAHLFLGSSLLALGRPAEAVPSLEHVVQARPGDPQSRGLLARSLLASSQPEQAIVHLQRLTELTPHAPRAWYDLGRAYNALVQVALASFDEKPDEAAWRTLLLADALRDDGRLGAAFGLYRRVIDQLPGTRAVHDALVAIYEKTGHADWAAEQRGLAAAVAIDCTKAEAECAFAAGRYDDVLSITAGKADPTSRYWRARAGAEATEAAFAELERLPDSRERRMMRAELARARGKHVESVKELKAALELAPGDPELVAELALSHYLARDFDQAIAVAKELVARTPDDAAVLALYGQALLELQRLDEAVPMLERAVKLAPSDGEARAALGRAYVQRGNFAAAIPLIVPALATDQDGALHFQLARAYQATGEPGKAKPLLRRYQELQRTRREQNAGTGDVAIVSPTAPK